MSKWRQRFDVAAREMLVGERFMFQRVCIRGGAWKGVTFRDYLQSRSENLGRRTWRDRVNCVMPDPQVVYAALVLERYLRLSSHRGTTPSRAEWLEANSILRVANLEVCAPVARMVGAGWTMTRVGSVWHRDEEYHVYVPTGAVHEAAAALSGNADDLPIVTPIFLFRREGRGVLSAEDPAIRGMAARKVGQMISATVGGKTNG